MAEALIIEARSKTVCRPPFVEMCAPMRSPCFSWKRKRGMREFAVQNRETLVNIHSRAVLFLSLLFATATIAAPVHVEKVTLHAGAATIELIDGTVVAETPAEAVFLGRGTIKVKPDDAIEAGQLELFTAKRELDEQFTEAVFVAASAETMATLTKGAPGGDAARAQTVYDAWKSGSERKQLGVESRLLAASLGDASADKFFVAHLHGSHLGGFDYFIDPAVGVAALGQFVPEKLTEREKRRVAGQLNKEHRRGRSLATEVSDLGIFNVWNESVAGTRIEQGDFEPALYHIDATIAPGAERLSGKTTIDLKTIRGHRRVIPLHLDQDLTVSQVTDAAGAALRFSQSGGQLAVVLPSPAEDSQQLAITVAYDGVTRHWPAGLALRAAGKRVDGGERWEKRALDIPSDAYTFEIGHFAIETIQAGHVNVRLAFDPESEDKRQVAKALQNDTGRRNAQIDFRARGITKQGRDEIRQQLRDSLLFYEQLFGPYPLDALTVVTVPRELSQGLPGFISLSTDMMTDPGTEFKDLFTADTDRRLVIAHEVAHQWWGDLIGTSNAGGGWLEEAMASYAATVYSRQKLDWRGRFQIGFTTRWPASLLHREHGARPVESLGPLVLGSRLYSSRAPYAYNVITYEKGALVLDMLAQSVGEQKFHAILRDLVAHESQKVISTESFLGYVSRGSGHDLQAFSKYFVYGTGVPEIEYEAEVRGSGGKGAIHLTGERVDPWRYQVRVAKRDDGKLDVVRDVVPVTSAPLPTLLVPMQVALENRTNPGEGLKYAKRMIDLSNAKFALDFDIPWAPKDVVLDRDREVLALLYSKGRSPKEVLLKRGLTLAAAGKTAEAEAAFKEALAAKPSTELQSSLNPFAPIELSLPAGVDIGSSYKDVLLDVQKQVTTAALHLSLARLYIDTSRDAAAADELKQANRALDHYYHDWIDGELAVLESRLDVHRGDYKAAYDRLAKRGSSAEAYALYAIAAKQSGQTDLQKAIDDARELGVDVTAIGN